MAYVEIISSLNQICAVEFPGEQPLFITKMRDKDNKLRWVSIPQGHDDLAKKVGGQIEKYFHNRKSD